MSLLTLFRATTRPTILLAGFLWALHGVAHAQDNPRVSLVTNKGAIEIELLPKFAPKHVANFLSLVEEEFYVGLVFHRVIPNFMIQAGGYDGDLNYKASERRVENESFNGLKNKRLTLAMARLNDPDSADVIKHLLDTKANQIEQQRAGGTENPDPIKSRLENFL